MDNVKYINDQFFKGNPPSFVACKRMNNPEDACYKDKLVRAIKADKFSVLQQNFMMYYGPELVLELLVQVFKKRSMVAYLNKVKSA